MTNKLRNSPTLVADQPCRHPPVRVKLVQPDAYSPQTCPPDGERQQWWLRLNQALGTASSDFVNASLLQLQAAARSPYGTISETAMNAALAIMRPPCRKTRSRQRSPFRCHAPTQLRWLYSESLMPGLGRSGELRH